jgi:hypothetical protein
VIDRANIGRVFAPVVTVVDAPAVAAFRGAIGTVGATGVPFSDDDADTIPPTFPFCLEMLHVPTPFGVLDALDVALPRLLHGEQHFRYHAPMRVGDTVTFTSRISDIYEKKNGALEFVVHDTDARDAHDTLLVEMRSVLVIRPA